MCAQLHTVMQGPRLLPSSGSNLPWGPGIQGKREGGGGFDGLDLQVSGGGGGSTVKCSPALCPGGTSYTIPAPSTTNAHRFLHAKAKVWTDLEGRAKG